MYTVHDRTAQDNLLESKVKEIVNSPPSSSSRHGLRYDNDDSVVRGWGEGGEGGREGG